MHIPGFVGFRCTQSNLHFTGTITKCETQQRPISEPIPESFFLLIRPTALCSVAGLTPETKNLCHAAQGHFF
ncbi:hypothetical protein D1AOALGA4SA_10674 [Olavius algarvensis Delta 1 endosymbiont]|nr:hypothetical protein D1AOALGA4SA_10674 [Olavius algarvensis Delta 1 endosymbiont]